MNVKLIAIVVIYLLAVAILGYIAYRRTRSDKDYLIAGGNVHPYLMALAYGSTFISTSAIVGFGGTAGMYGMSLLWLTFANIFVGIFLAFVFFGKRTLILGRNLDAHTFPEFLGRRYQSDFIQRYAAVVVTCAMPLYAAAVMIGGSRFLEQTLNINYELAVWVFALFVAAYVITGGLKGVVYTDALQGSIMFIGMSLLLVMTYAKLGGILTAHKALTALSSQVPASLAQKGHLGWTSMPALGSEYWWVVVSTLVMGVGIGVLAQPQLIVRYLTVKAPRELNRAVVVGGIFILMMTGVAFVVGSLSNAYFAQTTGKIALTASIDPATNAPNVDRIIPLFINSAMPSWFTYLFTLTLMAAAMSTLSGQFHVIGTSLSRDLYAGSKSRSVKHSLLINRLGLAAAMIITVWLTFRLPAGIIAVATSIFFGVCAASFLPAYAAALYWPRATTAGAIASMVIGSLSSLFWLTFVYAKGAAGLGISKALTGKATLAGFPWTVVDPIVISLPLSALTMVVVSLLTSPVEEAFYKKLLTPVSGAKALPEE
ncbi:MAG: sodium:solute symporter family protein [Peptococcaceae bacterium]|nr:sodium:solute symporter family protein [Peptococcaceae bacterium]MDH7524665.1 sodium:solute symporter family protein [Peptococcaceae bacterium]